jgi:Bacterial protein of unknown function (Gcw_chp)
MKRLVLSTTAALLLSTGLAAAADMAVKAPPAPAPAAAPAPAFDVAFGAAVMTDYNFRGISQSNNRPAVNAYFEPRYNFNPDWQIYAGVGGYSIEFPNNAAAEIDIYGGIRPTFGKLALDFGVWYYYYPGGRTFTGFTGTAPNLFDPNPFCTNLFTGANSLCNAIKDDLSFIEFYGKGTYTFNDNFAAGAAVYYDPDWLNTGAPGWYVSGNAKFTGNAFPSGINWYVSGELAHYFLGTTDFFYAFTPLPDYTTWNIGVGLTYKVFTLDFRYYDTDLSKAECNVLTGDHTASFSPANITPINGSGLGSSWCGSAFIVALKADLTLNTNIK